MITVRIERTWQHGPDKRWIISAFANDGLFFIFDSIGATLREALVDFKARAPEKIAIWTEEE